MLLGEKRILTARSRRSIRSDGLLGEGLKGEGLWWGVYHIHRIGSQRSVMWGEFFCRKRCNELCRCVTGTGYKLVKNEMIGAPLKRQKFEGGKGGLPQLKIRCLPNLNCRLKRVLSNLERG